MDGGEREREESPDVRREPAKGGRPHGSSDGAGRASERACPLPPPSLHLSLTTATRARAHAHVRASQRRARPGERLPARKFKKRGADVRARQGQAAAAALSLMILPQVHLRKPCYDFYFL